MKIIVVGGLLLLAATSYTGFAYGTFARAAAIEKQRIDAEQARIRGVPAVPPIDDSSVFTLASDTVCADRW